MDTYTFICRIIELVIWPFCIVFLVTWFLWYFRESIRKLISRLRKAMVGGNELEFEPEEIAASRDDKINKIAECLTNGPHSFKWLREKKKINYTNEEFEKIIRDNPRIFKFTRTIKRDENGNRIRPGNPAIKLLKI